MPPPQAIDSAYNFVPLSGFVLEPEWRHQVSHDIPFRDGASGRLRLTVTAHSPILVAGDKAKKDRDARFFRLPDGTCAIPGSALRGVIRSVVEIAAFGAMRHVDDRRLGVRDLTRAARPFYGDRLTHAVHGSGRPLYAPSSRAGWLRLEKRTGKWWLTPCEVARVEHAELERHRRGFRIDGRRRPPAHETYKAWRSAGGSLAVTMDVAAPADHPHQRGSILIRYRKASFGAGTGATRGTLVFTGQPGPNKHLEFFFFGPSRSEVEVPREAMDAFFAIHAENEDWLRHWRPALKRGAEVPVFWLQESGRLSSLGLAMMFRLAYERSIHEVIRHSNPLHGSDAVLDLATLLFGRAARDDGEETGLKGRVSFGHAKAMASPQPERHGPTVLNAPKPTYYPNYIRQPLQRGRAGHLGGNGYATYSPQPGPTELQRPEIRGWKRYPARPADAVRVPPPPEGAKPELISVLHPLPAGTRFEGEVRFHNLRPQELGALLWALEWGGRSELRHGLGMGKPFGFGQVAIEVGRDGWGNLRPNDPKGTRASFDDYLKAFEDFMEQAYARGAERPLKAGEGWRDSEQLVQLRAMADPRGGGDFPGELRAMALTVDPPRNEFRDAKGDKRRGTPSLVLADYARFDGAADRDLFPRQQLPGPVRATPARPAKQPAPGGSAAQSGAGPAGAGRGDGSRGREEGGLAIGAMVAVAGDKGRVVGFEGDKVLVDFGDGPEALPRRAIQDT